MTLKGQKTASEPIPWDKFRLLIIQLENDKDYMTCLLAAIGTFFLMRIGDVLNLTWADIITKDLRVKNKFVITEGKNKNRIGKKREIEINDSIKELIERNYQNLKVKNINQKIFLRKDKSGVISKQYVNQKMKTINSKYKLGLDKISSHSFRKTFAREYWEQNGRTEASLRYLKNTLGHRSIEHTEIYIGIRKDEIKEVYNSLKL